MPRRIVLTGGSGLIGTALRRHLLARGDEVRSLVRAAPAGPDEIYWHPQAAVLDRDALGRPDAVIHLAGAGVGDHRWTPAYKETIRESRVSGTATLVAALAQVGAPVRLVSGSAVGAYGSRGEEVLTEESAPGEGFLAEVVRDWEAEAMRGAQSGLSVACARTGLVMAPHGGAFAPLIRLARWGLGGPLGSGRQYWPWITLVDEVRALTFLVDHPELTGPVNVTGPDPVPQRIIAAEFGRQLRRPALLPTPGFALRLAVGEFAGDILASQRVLPQTLTRAGFEWRHDTLAAAVAATLEG